jgi:hypothetical protein
LTAFPLTVPFSAIAGFGSNFGKLGEKPPCKRRLEKIVDHDVPERFSAEEDVPVAARVVAYFGGHYSPERTVVDRK